MICYDILGNSGMNATLVLSISAVGGLVIGGGLIILGTALLIGGAFAINAVTKWNSIQDGTWEPIEEGGFTMNQYAQEMQEKYEMVQAER